jgi:predicted transcriptional regulator YdeE/DNA-binding transcriptional MerR regulator
MLKIGDFSKLAQVSVKTLRYYGDLGLLKPAWIDRYSGYRYYTAAQLPRLNRILALKDLGFSLEQILGILDDDLSAADLRGMLRLKRAELEHHIRSQQERLQRIENRMQYIELEGVLPHFDVVLKDVPSRQVIGIRRVVPDIPQVEQLLGELLAYLYSKKVSIESSNPPLAIYYDSEYHDRGMDVEVAVPLSGRLPGTKRLMVHELPAVTTMACTVHRGGRDHLPEAHGALMTWVENNGYRICGPNREIYFQASSVEPYAGKDLIRRQFEDKRQSKDIWNPISEQSSVIELQFPVQRKPTSILVNQDQEKAKMEPKIVEKPGFTALGMVYHGKNENDEIAGLWADFNPRIPEINHIVDGAFGVCGETKEDGAFKYMAGFAVSSTEDIPDDMETWELPAQKYAVFPCTLKNIGETYRYAFDTWLPASAYEFTGGPDFEYYDEEFDEGGEDAVLYVYIPIK